jgi:serine/threonine-protein kinase
MPPANQPPYQAGSQSSGGGRSGTPWIIAGIVVAAAVIVAAVLFLGGCTSKKTVPNTVNQPAPVAEQVLNDEGFKTQIKRVKDDQVTDIVLEQDPPAGDKAKEGSTIVLTVSAGPGDGVVPDVTGVAADHAENELRQAGFKTTVKEVFSSTYDSGIAVDTEPRAGTEEQKGKLVTILVSKGAQATSVPNVVGESESAAQKKLRNLGFSVDREFKQSNKTPGEVLAQDPPAGTKLLAGGSVQILIDRAPSKATVPNVVGYSRNGAESRLSKAGFDAVFVHKTVSNQTQNGVALSQSPGGGSKATEGTNVTVTIGRYRSPKPKPPTPPTPPTPPPGPANIVKQFQLDPNTSQTFTATWSSGKCPAGNGNAYLSEPSSDGGTPAQADITGAQITDQGSAGKTSYYATVETTSDYQSGSGILIIDIECLVK